MPEVTTLAIWPVVCEGAADAKINGKACIIITSCETDLWVTISKAEAYDLKKYVKELINIMADYDYQKDNNKTACNLQVFMNLLEIFMEYHDLCV